jgi:hypothetical protein
MRADEPERLQCDRAEPDHEKGIDNFDLSPKPA